MRLVLFGEDNAHFAVLEGLRRRFCPEASAVRGGIRMPLGPGAKRRLRQAFVVHQSDGEVTLGLLLVDADDEGWAARARGQHQRMPEELRDLLAVGVPDRDVECWLAADPHDLAAKVGGDEQAMLRARQQDLKALVHGAFRQAADREGVGLYDLMASFVESAELREWFEQTSFEEFWHECQALARRVECELPPRGDAEAPQR